MALPHPFEKYVERVDAFALPIKANSRDLQAAFWAVDLKRQVPFQSTQEFSLDNPFLIIYKYIIAK